MPLSKQLTAVVPGTCTNLIITYASMEAGFMTKSRITTDNRDLFEEGDIGTAVGGYNFRLLNAEGEAITPTQVG